MRIFTKTAGMVFMGIFLNSLPVQSSGLGLVHIDTEGAGKAVAELLKPIVEPLAKEFVAEAALKLKAALNALSQESLCELNCVTFQAVNCRPLLFKKAGELKVAACKDQCQQIIKVGGGYTLKIRYTNGEGSKKGWSLQSCVQTAKNTGVHIFREINTKSIAIYGDKDFDLAMEIIGEIAALDKIVLTNGKVYKDQGKSVEEVKAIVAEAKSESERLNKDFQKYAQENLGPQ